MFFISFQMHDMSSAMHRARADQILSSITPRSFPLSANDCYELALAMQALLGSPHSAFFFVGETLRSIFYRRLLLRFHRRGG